MAPVVKGIGDAVSEVGANALDVGVAVTVKKTESLVTIGNNGEPMQKEGRAKEE